MRTAPDTGARKEEREVTQVAEFDWLDEEDLSFEDRLALAHLRLRYDEWDPIIGPKPAGFDELPAYCSRNFWGRRKPCKYQFTRPARLAIQSIIGSAYISRFEATRIFGKTDEEWLADYVASYIPDPNQF